MEQPLRDDLFISSLFFSVQSLRKYVFLTFHNFWDVHYIAQFEQGILAPNAAAAVDVAESSFQSCRADFFETTTQTHVDNMHPVGITSLTLFRIHWEKRLSMFVFPGTWNFFKKKYFWKYFATNHLIRKENWKKNLPHWPPHWHLEYFSSAEKSICRCLCSLGLAFFSKASVM